MKKSKEQKQFAVIGLGRFGASIAKDLYANGKDVLAIDINPAKANAIADYVTHSAIADMSDEASVTTVGLKNFDVVVVCMGSNIQNSILCTLLAKEAGVPLVVAKARDERHKSILYKIGADYVVEPESDIAKKVAAKLMNPHLGEVMELSSDFHIAELDIPPSWAGQTIAGLEIRRKFNVTVLMIKTGTDVIVSPDPLVSLSLGGSVIAGGTADNIAKFVDKLKNIT